MRQQSNGSYGCVAYMSADTMLRSSFLLPELMKFFNARKAVYHTNARLIDEVIYTPYFYDPAPSNMNAARHTRTKLNHQSQDQTGDLLGVPELHLPTDVEDGDTHAKKRKSKFDTRSTEAEIFLFDYGTVVIWGMTEAQEKRFLSSM